MFETGAFQQIELLGERYDVQTELVDPHTGTVRTTIFHAGQLVALREAKLAVPANPGAEEAAVRDRVRTHHREVVERFLGSRLGDEWCQEPGDHRGIRSAPRSDSLEAAEGDVAPTLPPQPEDPAVADGFDVRRLFAELRRRLGVASPARLSSAGRGLRRWLDRLLGQDSTEPATGASERLVEARTALAWARRDPRFRRVRIDEQVLFHRLEGRVREWEDGGRDPDEGRVVWSEIVAFCDYLAEINLRSELVEFDRRLLAWGLGALERHGASSAALGPLRWLSGRDSQLDALLEAEEAVSESEWIAHLRRVQRSLDG